MHKSIKYISITAHLTLLNFQLIFSQVNENILEFEFVKGGCFYRGNIHGNEDEKTVRKIFVDDFFISSLEITNKQYCEFLNQSGITKDSIENLINISLNTSGFDSTIYHKQGSYYCSEKYENFPVTHVSWYGADAYCKFHHLRLPTEAEWEYAAKGGKNFIRFFFRKKYLTFSGSNTPEQVSWYRDNSDNQIHQPGLKLPNKLNLYDMSGNVDEWCSDWYSLNYYSESDTNNPQGPPITQFKVIRGGSWYNTQEMLSVTNRRASNPKNKKATIGFRVVKDVK